MDRFSSAYQTALVRGLVALLEMASPWAIDVHIARIRDRALRREQIRLARELERDAADFTLTADEVAARDLSRREDFDSLARTSGRLRGASLSGPEFLALTLPPSHSLLGEGLIVPGTYTLFAGKPGTCKTWLALMIAYAVASGSSWFGFETPAGGNRVGFIELELPARQVQKRLSIVAGDGAPALENIRIIARPILTGVLDLSRPTDLADFRAWIEREQLALVVLDALGRAHSLDQNDLSLLLNALDPVLQETGCALLLLHHDKKGSDDQHADDIDQPRGDSRLAGNAAATARAVLRGRGTDNLRSLRFGKVWDGPLPDEIWFECGADGLPHVTTAPAASAEARSDKTREAVFAALEGLQRPANTQDVHDQIGNGAPSPNTVRRKLRELVELKRVVHDEAKTGRSRVDIWGVAPPDALHALHDFQNDNGKRGIS